jgi:rRNA maturation protein Nop10
MTIKLTCSGCGSRFRVKDRYTGRRTKCPKCGGAIVVPVPHPATPNGRAKSVGSRQSARVMTRNGSAEVDKQYVSPPFQAPGSSNLTAPGHHAPRPAKAERSGSPRRRNSRREPWYDLLSRSLGLASLAIGGASLIVGLPVNQMRGGGTLGAILVVGCALAASVSGAGLLLLGDVARAMRRVSRRADRDS